MKRPIACALVVAALVAPSLPALAASPAPARRTLKGTAIDVGIGAGRVVGGTLGAVLGQAYAMGGLLFALVGDGSFSCNGEAYSTAAWIQVKDGFRELWYAGCPADMGPLHGIQQAIDAGYVPFHDCEDTTQLPQGGD